MTARAVEISAVAHLAALFLRHVATHPAVRIHPPIAMSRRLQVHRSGVAEIAAIGNFSLPVTGHALRHEREIRLAGDVRSVDAFVARPAGNPRYMLVVREARQRDLARLLDRRRRIVTLHARFGPRQVVVFHARAPLHRSVAGGALQLQCQVLPMREISALCEGRGSQNNR